MTTICLAERHDLQELPIRGLGISLNRAKMPLQPLRIDKRLSTPLPISHVSCHDLTVDAQCVHPHRSIGTRPTPV